MCISGLNSPTTAGTGVDCEKRIVHPEVGLVELQCQVLVDPEQGHSLLVYTATPGTQSYDKLALLSVVGDQSLTSG